MKCLNICIINQRPVKVIINFKIFITIHLENPITSMIVIQTSLQKMVSVPTKTNPTLFTLIVVSRNTFLFKEVLDDLICAVSRSVILNNPVINIFITRFKHSTNHFGFVLEHRDHYNFGFPFHNTLCCIKSRTSLSSLCSSVGA